MNETELFMSEKNIKIHKPVENAIKYTSCNLQNIAKIISETEMQN